jgi:hypothetical protein
MVLYNLTWVNQSNTIVDMATGVNMLTGGSFFPMANILILLVITFAMKSYDWTTAAVVAGAINLIITAMFYFTGLVGNTSLFINMAVLFGALFFKAVMD